MCSVNQRSSGRSSARPRRSVMAAWPCVLTSPGSTMRPRASHVVFAAYRALRSAERPAARILPFATASAPSSTTDPSVSIGTRRAPTTRRSAATLPAGAFLGGAAPVKIRTRAAVGAATAKRRIRRRVTFAASEVERLGKENRQGQALALARGGGHDNRHVSGELPEDLPACAAGRRRFVRVRHDGDRPERANALGKRLPDRHAPRADGQPVRAVLDVAPSPDLSVRVFDRRADGKSASLRYGVDAVAGGRFDEPVVAAGIGCAHATASAIFGTAAASRRTKRSLTRRVVSG